MVWQWSDPVFGADPEPVGTGRGKRDSGEGIRHRTAVAMGQKVGRAHQVDELLIEDPAAREK